MMLKFKCKQCGKCCKWYADTRCFYIELEDYERWSINDRWDILAYITKDEDEALIGWYDPLTGLEVDICPFLEKIGNKWICSIHETKPKHCKDYPLNEIQLEDLGCPGRE